MKNQNVKIMPWKSTDTIACNGQTQRARLVTPTWRKTITAIGVMKAGPPDLWSAKQTLWDPCPYIHPVSVVQVTFCQFPTWARPRQINFIGMREGGVWQPTMRKRQLLGGDGRPSRWIRPSIIAGQQPRGKGRPLCGGGLSVAMTASCTADKITTAPCRGHLREGRKNSAVAPASLIPGTEQKAFLDAVHCRQNIDG